MRSMDPPSQHHRRHQEMESHQTLLMESHQTLESMLECTKAAAQQEKKPKPAEDALKCPRCDSTNTKFCYYNNYSLTQPRYFCKSCRRYWTKGGTLRNVPVGGGCRKNKRSSSKRSQDQAISSPNPINNPLSSLSYDSDISLAIARLQSQNVGQMGFGGEHGFSILGNNNNNHLQYDVLGNHGLMDSMRGGFFENPSNGYNCGNMGYLENGGLSLGFNGGGGDEMGNSMPYNIGQEVGGFGMATTAATTVATVKQESMCNSREGESRVLMGFPWQFGGEAGKLVDFEPVKQNWNGFGPSSWHGLLNSPLM